MYSQHGVVDTQTTSSSRGKRLVCPSFHILRFILTMLMSENAERLSSNKLIGCSSNVAKTRTSKQYSLVEHDLNANVRIKLAQMHE